MGAALRDMIGFFVLGGLVITLGVWLQDDIGELRDDVREDISYVRSDIGDVRTEMRNIRGEVRSLTARVDSVILLHSDLSNRVSKMENAQLRDRLAVFASHPFSIVNKNSGVNLLSAEARGDG